MPPGPWHCIDLGLRLFGRGQGQRAAVPLVESLQSPLSVYLELHCLLSFSSRKNKVSPSEILVLGTQRACGSDPPSESDRFQQDSAHLYWKVSSVCTDSQINIFPRSSSRQRGSSRTRSCYCQQSTKANLVLAMTIVFC